VTTDEIRNGVIEVLTTIAPEARGQPLAPTVNLREQLDLDSMDALNFVIGLHEAFGVEIPEADYAKLESLETIVTYLTGRLAEHQRT
jgi:acyl carrier protein